MGEGKRKQRVLAEAGSFEAEVERISAAYPELAGLDLAPIVRAVTAFVILPSPFAVLGLRDGRAVFAWTYAGMARLALTGPGSNLLARFEARAAYDKDTLLIDYGRSVLQHAPFAGDEPGPLVGAYAVAVQTNGAAWIEFAPARLLSGAPPVVTTGADFAEEALRRLAVRRLVAVSPLELSALRGALALENELSSAPARLPDRPETSASSA
jgi:hypothetical protein